MCGIVGIISRKQVNTFQIDEIKEMSATIKHRGPNDSGIVGINYNEHKGEEITDEEAFWGKSVIAFNRLSIQDLSQNGHQPMMNAEQNVVLAFNGEIYNFIELRKELQRQGCTFKSKTDTEVILSLYLQHGIEKTLKKLNGMFAIVIYDLRLERVYIARDRFGIKPMYFTSTEGSFLFSSEVKSFLKYHEFQADIDKDTLQEYILFRNVTDGVLLKNVKQVLPGELYQISLKDNCVRKHKYFSVNEYNRICDNQITLSDTKELLWETMKNVIGRQIISDVKVGCQLSGGIDSSLVSYIASREYGLSDTISIVVNDERFSEEKYIDHVNNILRIMYHKYMLDADYYSKKYVEAVWHFEGLMLHASTVGIYQIAEEARKHVTVLLSGEGADEVFGGYGTYLNTIDCSEEAAENLIIFGNGVVEPTKAKEVFPEIEIEKQLQKRRDIYSALQGSVFDKQVKYEIMTYLPELLVRQDKMSMANSIENRVPMLDNEIVEFAFRIPENFLINREKKEGKDILKQLCVPIFGEEFAYSRKRGFSVPTNKFLFSRSEFVTKVLKSMKQRDIVNWKYMFECSKNVEKLKGLEAELFFKLFSFEVWCELFVDKKSVMEVMGMNY